MMFVWAAAKALVIQAKPSEMLDEKPVKKCLNIISVGFACIANTFTAQSFIVPWFFKSKLYAKIISGTLNPNIFVVVVGF